MHIIREIFAITRDEMFRIRALGPLCASAIKTRSRGITGIGVGDDLCTKDYRALAIGEELLAYHPQQRQRNPLMIHERFWRNTRSSPIIGLFHTEDEAIECFDACENTSRNNPQWDRSIEYVLGEIGAEHESFFVFTDPKHSLVKKKKEAA